MDATVGRGPGDGVPSHNLFYDCAADADKLELSATLHRDGAPLLTRGPELHWWLTGFKWRVLSDRSQLSVDVAITLKNGEMRDAFLTGVDGRPYPNLQVNGTTVSFTFAEPFAVPQPPRPAPALELVEAANQAVVNTYNAMGFPTNDPNVVEAEFLGVKPSVGKLRQVFGTRKDAAGDITHLCGGPDADWGPVPVADAMTQIRSRAVIYFTNVDGAASYVRIIDSAAGAYLRTGRDVTQANNLDALPAC